jgi:hypothetical protein
LNTLGVSLDFEHFFEKWPNWVHQVSFDEVDGGMWPTMELVDKLDSETLPWGAFL